MYSGICGVHCKEVEKAYAIIRKESGMERSVHMHTDDFPTILAREQCHHICRNQTSKI